MYSKMISGPLAPFSISDPPHTVCHPKVILFRQAHSTFEVDSSVGQRQSVGSCVLVVLQAEAELN